MGLKNSISDGCEGELEMVNELIIGEPTRKTHISIKNFQDYEAYINTIDVA